jgi:hypothetical protein
MYRRQIETFIKAYINFITKVEFFLAFYRVYKQSITLENTQSGFRRASLMPLNPDVILSRLNIKLRTPSPSSVALPNTTPWVSQTPQNPIDALSQVTLVKDRITRHQGNSPTPTFNTTVLLARGIEVLAHEVTLLSAEIRILRLANKALSKRRKAKKTRLRQGSILPVGDAYDVLSQREVTEQIKCERRSKGVGKNKGQSGVRRCSTCRKTSHNTRTCQEVNEVSSLSDSE